MSHDNELSAAGGGCSSQEFQKFQLAAWRESCFGFVEQIESLALITAIEERHERLAVRLGHQRFAAEIL